MLFGTQAECLLLQRMAPMKRIVTVPLLLIAFAVSSIAQIAPAPNDQQLARAVKELQEQQTAIAQNQAKIEEKLAAVAEAVRQARIFASRAGVGKR